MISGKLDRRISFQSKSEAINASGERAVTWAADFTVWGAVIEMKGRERYENMQLTDRADVKIKIRYRTGITEESRFYYTRQGTTTYFDVYSIAEIGREDGLEIWGKRRHRT